MEAEDDLEHAGDGGEEEGDGRVVAGRSGDERAQRLVVEDDAGRGVAQLHARGVLAQVLARERAHRAHARALARNAQLDLLLLLRHHHCHHNSRPTSLR